MTDLLSRGSDFLRLQRKRHMASPVYYVRGGTSSARVLATRGSTSFEVTGDAADQMPVSADSIDFLIDVEDLYLDGLPVTPQRGDQVIAGELDDGIVYEVMNPDPSQPPWRFSDPYRLTYRIHTKQVGTRPPTP